MKKAANIIEFKNYFFEGIYELLTKDQFKLLKSKNTFELKTKLHLKSVEIYFYKRHDFIEIETKAYFGNYEVDNLLKSTGVKYLNFDICGGSISHICTTYFNEAFPEKYENLIYDINEDISPVISAWKTYYERYIKNFLNDCTNPILLNHIVNDVDMHVTGLNLSYENRVLKSIPVALLANLSNENLEKLVEEYSNALIEKKAKYSDKFEVVKNKLLIDIKK
ncbi:hypothetical protein [Pedobacter sp. D749]|uniref:hypothetical protein n=1 Tax=Pedobacter sp. D749 TaxID=2856523 RepID=UPI001C594416|nr:hypothetical protein [Pedobacter sp. D749]QXU44105.1 hypothetical protein KYH19_11135 [Pedobacter sp. D749]